MVYTKDELAKVKAFERLGLTPEEIEQTILDDREINRGVKMFELTADQEKASKKARATGTRKASQTERTRKTDEDKRELISMIFDLFRDSVIDDEPITEIKLTNPERQIDFTYNDRKFRIVLSAPRK